MKTETFNAENITLVGLGTNVTNPPVFGRIVNVSVAGYSTIEPESTVTPNGAIYVLGPSCLWVSYNGGASFDQLNITYPLGPARNGGDSSAVFPQNDGLWYSDLNDPGLTMGRLPNGSSTWLSNITTANNQHTDRPWIANDSDYVYVAYNMNQKDALGHFGPATIEIQRATIGGDPITGIPDFQPITLNLTHFGGSPNYHIDGKLSARHGHLIVPVDVNYSNGTAITLFDSSDQGATWTASNVTFGQRNVTDSLVASAIDDAGNEYVAWSNGSAESPRLHGYLNFSWRAMGASSWSSPIIIQENSTMTAVFPTIVAGKYGRVGVAYYGTNTSGDPADFSVNASWLLYYAYAENITYGFNSTTQVDPYPVHEGGMCQGGGCTQSTCVRTICTLDWKNRSFGDYFGATVFPDGRTGISYCDDHWNPQPDSGTECPIRFAQEIDGGLIR